MFKCVTLEMSLKPFRSTDETHMRNVVENLFEQWRILIKDAETISVLFWTADGSEILEWSGELDKELEWCRYIGKANSPCIPNANDPEGIGPHVRAYYYMDNPPTFTYGTLKKIVSLVKETGRKMYPDKKIRVGETFDPGPEFSISKFKYSRHNEICYGATMGANTVVCCYATLHADDVKYAGFPDGIEEGTPFATFFGRQAQLFLKEMDFDYLWLSNGFGFGMETWGTTGAIFDGKKFDVSHFDDVKEKILNFWKLFRQECDYRVETRGTNLTVGIDIASDGDPLKDIYEGNFNIMPPPNSPWAALNANFGLELAGYMSRICQLPDEEYMFRFYVHDPWWANTPWTDRYDSLPHDIYLPMSVCRIDGEGKVKLPTHLNVFTADNSFGEMPDFCAHEPSVHINKARRYAPDAPSPVIWIYPFDEYHSYRDEKSIKEIFFGDWFMIGAMNHGLPVSSVITTTNFVKAVKANPNAFKGCVMISVVPEKGTEYEKEIIALAKNGLKIIFYGNAGRASEEFLSLAGIEILPDEISGELEIVVENETDKLNHGQFSNKIIHRDLFCGGGINTDIRKGSNTKPFVRIGGRVAGTCSENVVWLDGTCSAQHIYGQLLTPDDEKSYYSGESLMRKALDTLGIKIRFEKEYADSIESIITISRHDNAHMFAISARDTTVTSKIKMPLGAPIFMGRETKIDEDGSAVYNFSRAEFLECRIFVEQEGGVISCHDINPCSFFRRRRIKVTGLENATVRFFAPRDCETNIEGILNSDDTWALVGEKYDGEYVTDQNGTYYEAKNVTGKMIFAIPFEKLHGSPRKVEGNIPDMYKKSL